MVQDIAGTIAQILNMLKLEGYVFTQRSLLRENLEGKFLEPATTIQGGFVFNSSKFMQRMKDIEPIQGWIPLTEARDKFGLSLQHLRYLELSNKLTTRVFGYGANKQKYCEEEFIKNFSKRGYVYHIGKKPKEK